MTDELSREDIENINKFTMLAPLPPNGGKNGSD